MSSRRAFLGQTAGLFLAGQVRAFAGAEGQRRKAPRNARPPATEPSIPLQQQLALVKADGLEPIPNEEMLKAAVDAGTLVELPDNARITYDPYLRAEGEFVFKGQVLKKYRRDYCVPHARTLLLDLADAFAQAFPTATPLVVTSAVRPMDAQAYVVDGQISDAAVPVELSVHPTGATIDIAYGRVTAKGMNGRPVVDGFGDGFPGRRARESTWLRKQLGALEKEGALILRVERSQLCFHVVVARRYEECRAPLLLAAAGL